MINTHARKGFTLIELLIVVAIIGLLASVVLIGLGTFRSTGRDARRVADLRQVQSALELYFNKCGWYPGDPDCGTSGATQNANGIFSKDSTGLIAVFDNTAGLGIVKIPNDPLAPTTDVKQEYYYVTNDNTISPIGLQYLLRARLEDTNSQNLKNDIDVVPPQLDDGTIDCDDSNGDDGDQKRFYCIGI